MTGPSLRILSSDRHQRIHATLIAGGSPVAGSSPVGGSPVDSPRLCGNRYTGPFSQDAAVWQEQQA